jgi:GNAT superfamily N-acetyltransferase
MNRCLGLLNRSLRTGTRIAKTIDVSQHARLNLATLSDSDWGRCYALHCRAHAEQGTRARSLEAYRGAQLAAAGVGASRALSWVARDAAEVVGKLDLSWNTSMPELAVLNVYVSPEARRAGIARALVAEALCEAEREGVQRIETSTVQPESWRLCERCGGQRARGGALLTLRLTNTNWSLVDAWCADGPMRSPATRLQELEQLPSVLVDSFIALHNQAWSDQPHAVHAGEPVTLAQRREQERSYQRLGWRWITLVAREHHGVLVGLTDVLYDPTQREIVRQNFTGVLPSHRGRGLAKWLKASMLHLVRRRFPAALQLTTSNSDVNGPMLAINRRLGFGSPLQHRTYRFELAQLVCEAKAFAKPNK